MGERMTQDSIKKDDTGASVGVTEKHYADRS